MKGKVRKREKESEGAQERKYSERDGKEKQRQQGRAGREREKEKEQQQSRRKSAGPSSETGLVTGASYTVRFSLRIHTEQRVGRAEEEIPQKKSPSTIRAIITTRLRWKTIRQSKSSGGSELEPEVRADTRTRSASTSSQTTAKRNDSTPRKGMQDELKAQHLKQIKEMCRLLYANIVDFYKLHGKVSVKGLGGGGFEQCVWVCVCEGGGKHVVRRRQLATLTTSGIYCGVQQPLPPPCGAVFPNQGSTHRREDSAGGTWKYVRFTEQTQFSFLPHRVSVSSQTTCTFHLLLTSSLSGNCESQKKSKLLGQISSQTQHIEARCGRDVFLPCKANFNINNYFSVTWYKKSAVRKEIQKYGFPRDLSIDDHNSLVLQRAMPNDSGTYECSISANVGGQNQNLFVELAVAECEPETTPAVTTLSPQAVETERTFLNATHRAVHLPLTWSLLGYGAVGLTKIILSFMILMVFHLCPKRKRRTGLLRL
ncbi:hypothetical protein WMY93_027520 [Mugilogobius chulae]|uniref:Ig-like domain-containing protein n=1 Tax=Mugilogobius chulae TaxID=88201 RepID=A0AAW0N4Z5_9GOBI